MSSSVNEHVHEPHVLLFQYPGQGHMLPMLELADFLVKRGLNLTIKATTKNLQFLKHLLSKHPKIRTLVLQLPEHPMIPPGFENLKDLGNHGNVPMMNALGKLYNKIVDWFKGLEVEFRPVAIVSDILLGYNGEIGMLNMFLWGVNVKQATTAVHVKEEYGLVPEGLFSYCENIRILVVEGNVEKVETFMS